MKKSLLLLMTLLVFCGYTAVRAASDTDEATAAALSWLSLTDNGQYGQAYDQSSSFLRQNVKRDVLTAQLTQARTPLGNVVKRTLQSATPTTALPGAPAGRYVVITYLTSFDKRPGVTETITPMRDSDGKWRVSGYYLR